MIISRGVHPPEAMMHFPPVSDFPLFPKHFSDSVDNFPNFTFSRKISQFSSAKVSENYYFPSTFTNFSLLLQISLCFREIYVFLHTLCVFRFPPTFTINHLSITQPIY